MSSADRGRAHDAGLSDDDLVHAISLAALFGHFNRVADATAVELDYDVRTVPADPRADEPAFEASPIEITARPVLELARRPSTLAALTRWRAHAFERDAPLTRRQRTVISRWVARWLGDGSISSPTDLTVNPLDDALRELAERVTLAPWSVDEGALARLRAANLDDETLFDAVTVASTAGVISRLNVALASLSRERC